MHQSIVKGFPVGMLQANCFILGCSRSREAAVIDPGAESERILKTLEREELTLRYIINTHGHFDHIGANKVVKEKTGAILIAHGDDAAMLTNAAQNGSALWSDLGYGIIDGPSADRLVEEGETLQLGHLELKFLHTPGHTPGGICIHVGSLLFTGDTLFQGSIGRTDFPGSSLKKLLASIRDKLLVLDPKTRVLPGHGPESTIGEEKEFNPFVTGSWLL